MLKIFKRESMKILRLKISLISRNKSKRMPSLRNKCWRISRNSNRTKKLTPKNLQIQTSIKWWKIWTKIKNNLKKNLKKPKNLERQSFILKPIVWCQLMNSLRIFQSKRISQNNWSKKQPHSNPIWFSRLSMI